MNWNKLKTFYYIAIAGNLTKAASTLNISQSALSRQILDLEDQLNISLFRRYHGGLILTEKGIFLILHQEFFFRNRISAKQNKF